MNLKHGNDVHTPRSDAGKLGSNETLFQCLKRQGRQHEYERVVSEVAAGRITTHYRRDGTLELRTPGQDGGGHDGSLTSLLERRAPKRNEAERTSLMARHRDRAREANPTSLTGRVAARRK